MAGQLHARSQVCTCEFHHAVVFPVHSYRHRSRSNMELARPTMPGQGLLLAHLEACEACW